MKDYYLIPVLENKKWKKNYLLHVLKLACFLLLIPFLTSCSSSRTIVNGLDEKEANEILVFLSGKGINAQKMASTEGGGGGGGAKLLLWDVQVPEDQATEAMYLLNQAGLPRRRGQNLLNIFSGGGLVPSELQEKIRYQAGLAEQIASTIRKIDGVLDAEVQISFPEENPLKPINEQKKRITASVYVKHNGVLDDPNLHLIQKIKRLVASSVTGLDYDNVTVIGDRARSSTTGIIPGPLSEEEKHYVNVWSIILAQESVTRFQIIFFSFIVAILILLLTLIWVLWKLYPLLQRHGGMKELLNVHPISLESSTSKEAASVPETVAKEASEETKKSTVDHDIDET